MEKIKKFLLESPVAPIIILILGILFFAAGTYLTMSALNPAKTETVAKEKEETKEVIKYVYIKEKEETKEEKEDKKENKIVKKDKTTVKKPDGTVEIKETTSVETQSDSSKIKVEVQKVIEYVDKEKIVYKDREVTKTVTVTNQKDWKVGVLLGTSLYPLPEVSPTAPYINPIIVGVQVDRRIIGPFNAGLWVQTRSFKTVEAGLAISIDF